MGEKLVVGPINKGLKTDRTPFVIDNDSFPTLINAYQWRGRIKRKRGTSLLGRLQRFFASLLQPYTPGGAVPYTLTLNGGGSANALSGTYSNGTNTFSLQTNGNIVPGSFAVNDITSGKLFFDPIGNAVISPTGVITAATNAASCVLSVVNSFSVGHQVYISLVGGMTQLNGNTYTILARTPAAIAINVDSTAFGAYTSGGFATDISINSGSINYSTGSFTITGAGGDSVNTQFLYYPDLPVMGLEDLVLSADQFAGTLAFDTTYSYNIATASPYNIYDVSFYKNPTTATYVGYTQKTNVTPTTWNGLDYQQFWTTNYEGALWATNGINVPFNPSTIGMQYKPIISVTVVMGGPPATATLNITAHGLVVGDFLFINEVVTTTGINYQTGYVITVVDANNVTVEFPNATIAANGTGGIAQYLTNRSNTAIDCLRWYDGDPTSGAFPAQFAAPVLNGAKGWVNFMPPLSNLNYSIDDSPLAVYYLVGARIILPFKDRLLFFGPVIQSSTQAAAGTSIYLQDAVIYSQNGTPYYTASFTGSVTNSTTVYNPILVPANQTATPTAYFEDVTGYGGFIAAGVAQPIITVTPNEDVLIIGFTNKQTRLVYTGNDILPFNFFSINSEFGSTSTFSAVTMDRGALTVGDRGIVITAQVGSVRVDLDIPDQVFEFNLTNNGPQRVSAQRDFINEWVYFTYPSNEVTYNFPNQTLQYNYRDESWGIFNEAYTTYGQFRKVTGFTWATVGSIYPTWSSWNAPWNAGVATLLQPEIIAGNQQGFVIFRSGGSETGESNSLYIQSFSGSTVTSPNHCLNNGDYIVISGCIGTIGSLVNGNIFSVTMATTNTFVINPPIGSGTYFGGGVIQRMYVPFIQTKQFPTAWGMARKTRIGPQQYLFSTTPNGQIELQIYLSQNSDSAYNFGPIVPSTNVENNSLIYTDTLYTCPESTNLGLTAANINLNMVTAAQQAQIWHRMNTSLIGDTVQIGFTMSDAQMRDTTFSNQFVEIELHGFILDVTPSQVLA